MSPRIRGVSRACLPFFALVLTLTANGHGGAPSPTAVKEREAEPIVPNFEIQFPDGGTLRVRLLEKDLPLETPYGKLVIPADKVQSIECATRVPDALVKRVKSAIERLGAEEDKTRRAASSELAKLGRHAYPALLAAEKGDDAEVRMRAKAALELIRQSATEEELTVRPDDIVQTVDSTIAGSLGCASLRVESEAFGEQRVKVSNLRSISSLAHKREKVSDAMHDPGSLVHYQNQVGKVFVFQVTGVVRGHCWGTDTYTVDTTLAMAAVHAGVVKPGKTASVKVKMVGMVNSYAGSSRNEVTSANYGPMAGFEIIKK